MAAAPPHRNNRRSLRCTPPREEHTAVTNLFTDNSLLTAPLLLGAVVILGISLALGLRGR